MKKGFWISDKEYEKSKKIIKVKNDKKYFETYTFKKPQTKKYLLTLNSEMNINGLVSETTIEIRWLLSLKEIRDIGYKFELITLDHAMTKGAEMIELHKVVIQMQKALNELVFTLTPDFKLDKVLNLTQIQKRWQAVKQETFEYYNEQRSIQEIFNIQEQNFQRHGGVKAMVEAMEFFNIYFNGQYGTKFPITKTKKVPNLFRTVEIPFRVDYREIRQTDDITMIQFKSNKEMTSSSDIKSTYGKFPFVDSSKVIPQYEYNGFYNLNIENGFIENGEVVFTENVNDKLSGKLHYKIESYE